MFVSNQLQTNLDIILQDKNINLKPENLKAGITCLGVEGTYESAISKTEYNECLELSQQILGEDVSL